MKDLDRFSGVGRQYLLEINEDSPLNGHSRIETLGSANALKLKGTLRRMLVVPDAPTFVWIWLVLGPDNEIPFTSEKI